MTNAQRSACAARGWGPAPTTPAKGCAPWIPDLMHAQDEGQARMLMGRLEQAAMDAHFDITKPCTDGLIVRQASFAGV